MTLNKEQYAAFEDIVGAEYISDDPAITVFLFLAFRAVCSSDQFFSAV